MAAFDSPLRRVGVVACLSAIAWSMCACSTTYRGAAEVDPSELPRGRLVATYARTECSGADKSAVFIDYVQGADGTTFIVERGGPKDWLLITNSRLIGEVVVFQAVREAEPRELREYRFPRRGVQAGQYFWTKTFDRPRGSTHRFETQISGTADSCRLVPVDPVTGKALAVASAEATAPVASKPRGWGYDGSSFKVGDRIMVDAGGRTIPAAVLQAPGDAYFIRFDGEPEGAGRWIDPSAITGRVEN